ncbi:MAG: glycosyltransferase [Candidatus Colwellbacteria bacterium]|nr:glycosyltransferase [Candidatus Colwellbacteria bacterium]
MSINLRKFPLYSLPKILGWHMLVKQKHVSKQNKRQFGYNWWDLLYENLLPVKKGKIHVDTRKASDVIIINVGINDVTVANKNTGDIYYVKTGGRSTVNNISDSKQITLIAHSKTTEFHITTISNIVLVLVQVEQAREYAIPKSCKLFTDFLLMNGIPDKDQYLNTSGIEPMDITDVEDWRYEEDSIMKSEVAELLIDHWKITNIKTKKKVLVGIPHKIHWIWLSLTPTGEKFGDIKPRFYKFMESWIDRNPTFEFNIWTDNPDFKVPARYKGILTIRGPDDIKDIISRLPVEVRKNITYMFKNHPNVGARSDTLRQVILYMMGGIYSDINDGACLVSMKKLCDKFNYIIGMEPVMYVNNAIIGSRKKHTFSKNMLVWLSQNAKDFVEEWKSDYVNEVQDAKDDYIVGTTGPIALTSVILGAMIKKKYPGSLIAPSSYIYPNYWNSAAPSMWLKPISLTAHYDARDYLK